MPDQDWGNADGTAAGSDTGRTASGASGDGAPGAAATNVVPFPRSWYGSDEDLVPIDLTPPATAPADFGPPPDARIDPAPPAAAPGNAAAFWDGDPFGADDLVDEPDDDLDDELDGDLEDDPTDLIEIFADFLGDADAAGSPGSVPSRRRRRAMLAAVLVLIVVGSGVAIGLGSVSSTPGRSDLPAPHHHAAAAKVLTETVITQAAAPPRTVTAKSSAPLRARGHRHRTEPSRPRRGQRHRTRPSHPRRIPRRTHAVDTDVSSPSPPASSPSVTDYGSDSAGGSTPAASTASNPAASTPSTPSTPSTQAASTPSTPTPTYSGNSGASSTRPSTVTPSKPAGSGCAQSPDSGCLP